MLQTLESSGMLHSGTVNTHSCSDEDDHFVVGQKNNAVSSRLSLNYAHISVQSPAGALPHPLLLTGRTSSPQPPVLLELRSHNEGHFEAGSVGVEPSEAPPAFAASSGERMSFELLVKSEEG